MRSAYLFPTPSLLGHRRLTVSSIHSHNSCQAALLHTGLLLGPNCSLRFPLQPERGVMPPPGSWPQSTKVLFLHLAHICVSSPFINCPQLPSLRCPRFLLQPCLIRSRSHLGSVRLHVCASWTFAGSRPLLGP